MDKQHTISFIKEQLASGIISPAELARLVPSVSKSENRSAEVATSGTTSVVPEKQELSKNLINILYSIGALIVVVGVGILTAQHWNEIGFAGRFMVSTVLALASYIIAMFLSKPEHKTVSSVLYTLGAALAPLSAYVILNQAHMDFTVNAQILIAAALALVFGTALYVSKRNILVLITIAFATWTYYALISKMFGYTFWNADYLKWATMLLGVSYIALTYGLQSHLAGTDLSDVKERHAIRNILYGLGTLGILGASISWGGIFDLVTIALIFGAFYGSIYVKSRAMLLLAAAFLIGHIFKLTSRYFIDSIGWSVSLIVVGFLIIGIGYFTLYLNKKYIAVK